MFKTTSWEYSKEVEQPAEPRAEPEEGLRYLKITNATFDADNKEYTIYVEDLSNGAKFSLRYWLNSADKITNAIVPNNTARATLIGLGKALAGTAIGIPAVQDIKGGVVVGKVVLKQAANSDKRYPRVYEYMPAPEDIVIGFSDIEQFYDDTPVQEAQE